MLVTSGPPTGALGHIGDIAVDNVNAYLYGPKTIDGWPTGINLSLGPTGPQSTVPGPTGPGVTGPTGGYSFAATGPTAPALTLAGSVWLDDSTGKYFVRYGNLWVEIGVQGERGPTGPAARGGVNVQNATGTIELDGSAAKYQFINAVGSSRTLKLPTGVSAGYDLVITETGVTNDLAIQTTTATGVATVGGSGNPASVIVVWDGTLWKTITLT